MFERYTERARRVIFFARYEASVLGSQAIASEHLLLGLLREGKGAAGDLLRRREITHKVVADALEARAPQGESTSTTVDMPLAADAKAALGHAAEESARMRSEYVGSEHILLGLLRERGSVAAEVLGERGLALDEVRAELRLRAGPAGDGGGGAVGAFAKLALFLGRLDEQGAGYHVTRVHADALRVDVAVHEQRWAVTFFPDGRVGVEVFTRSPGVMDESAMAALLDRLGGPPPPWP